MFPDNQSSEKLEDIVWYLCLCCGLTDKFGDAVHHLQSEGKPISSAIFYKGEGNTVYSKNIYRAVEKVSADGNVLTLKMNPPLWTQYMPAHKGKIILVDERAPFIDELEKRLSSSEKDAVWYAAQYHHKELKGEVQPLIDLNKYNFKDVVSLN